MSSNFELPREGFVRLPLVLKVIPISKTAWWQGVKDGRYPKGIALAPRTTAWRVGDIRSLIDALAAQGPEK